MKPNLMGAKHKRYFENEDWAKLFLGDPKVMQWRGCCPSPKYYLMGENTVLS